MCHWCVILAVSQKMVRDRIRELVHHSLPRVFVTPPFELISLRVPVSTPHHINSRVVGELEFNDVRRRRAGLLLLAFDGSSTSKGIGEDVVHLKRSGVTRPWSALG